MTLRHIEIFATVCREGSITRAAERLYLSQPTVSAAIKEMEEHYGGALFERISRKLYLTPFGQRIYDYSLSLLNIYSDMSTANQKYDIIRVCTGTAIGKLFMPKIVKRFTSQYPNVRVQVAVGDANRMYELLMKNEADFVIAETEGDIYGLSHRIIQHYPIVAMCHKDNPLATKSPVSAKELSTQNLLLREPSSRTRKLVDLYFRHNNVEISSSWESYSVQSLLNATKEDLGISFHSLDHAVAFSSPELVILKIQNFDSERYVNINYLKNKIFSQNLQAFLDFFLEETQRMLLSGIEEYNRIHPDAVYDIPMLDDKIRF